MSKRFLTLFALVIVSVSTLANGWHITTRYYNSPDDKSQQRVEHTYLYGSYMKMETDILSTVFNLDLNQILYINHKNKTYWRGNPQRFVSEVRAEFVASIDQKLKNVDADKQEEMRKMYMEMIDASFSDQSAVSPKTFSVKELGDKQAIGGFMTKKYQVLEEGFLLETIWLSKDLPIANEFDFISLSHFLNQLAQGAYANSFEGSQEYFSLLSIGYPVKVEIPRGDGSIQISEVISANREALTETDFSVPASYTSSSLANVGVWEGYM